MALGYELRGCRRWRLCGRQTSVQSHDEGVLDGGEAWDCTGTVIAQDGGRPKTLAVDRA